MKTIENFARKVIFLEQINIIIIFSGQLFRNNCTNTIYAALKNYLWLRLFRFNVVLCSILRDIAKMSKLIRSRKEMQVLVRIL